MYVDYRKRFHLMMVLVIIEKNISSHDEKFSPPDGVGDRQKFHLVEKIVTS